MSVLAFALITISRHWWLAQATSVIVVVRFIFWTFLTRVRLPGGRGQILMLRTWSARADLDSWSRSRVIVSSWTLALVSVRQ